MEVFPDLTAIPNVYVTFPITSCTAEINFSILWIIINKFRSTMLEERLNYFYILPIQNVTLKSLSYEKTIKEYAAKKKVWKKALQWCVRHLVNKNIMLFFCDVCGISFFKFVIYCDFSFCINVHFRIWFCIRNFVSFFLNRASKIVKLQAPQNLDPPMLVRFVGSNASLIFNEVYVNW
jgi:hypothetical protein